MIHVLLCEDEPNHIGEFVADFGGTYVPGQRHVSCGDFLIEVLPYIDSLERRLKTDKIPDILVMDLFWPINQSADGRDAFQGAIESFKESIEILKREVPRNVKPRGLYSLYDDIRSELHLSDHDLPVILYTKAGQYVLDPDLLWKVEQSDTRFLLKADHPDLKKKKIRHIVNKWKFKNDVFISYSTTNTDVVLEIISELKKYKLKVFCSDKLRSGNCWQEDIRTGLIASRVAALILSREAVDSQWVAYEIGALWALGKIIVPGYIGISLNDVPELVRTKFQCSRIDSSKDRDDYINHIRFHCNPFRVD